MLAPATDRQFANHPPLQTLLHRLYSGVDALAFFTTLKAIVNEAMPHQRALTRSQKALLQALSSHLEAAARTSDITPPASIGDARALSALTKAAAAQTLLKQLTPAEREIVDLVRQGWSNKEIACMLDKSVRTVKTQLTSVYKKFAVRSRGRLLAKLS